MTTTALLPRPIIDPSVTGASDMFFRTKIAITDLWWLDEVDDRDALIELENRLEPLSRYMTALN